MAFNNKEYCLGSIQILGQGIDIDLDLWDNPIRVLQTDDQNVGARLVWNPTASGIAHVYQLKIADQYYPLKGMLDQLIDISNPSHRSVKEMLDSILAGFEALPRIYQRIQTAHAEHIPTLRAQYRDTLMQIKESNQKLYKLVSGEGQM